MKTQKNTQNETREEIDIKYIKIESSKWKEQWKHGRWEARSNERNASRKKDREK